MQFPTRRLLLSMVLLSVSLSLTTAAPAPQQQALSEIESFQDASEAELNPLNGERRRRAGGKDVGDAAEIGADASLELPGELLNKSFQTVTNVSKAISRLMLNSARRYSRFVLFFKPIFGDALVVKGSEDPTTTTTTPRTTSTTTEAEKVNEI